MASRGVNKVILIGNVGKDPEIRYMPNGNAVANFTLATSETWKDKNTGESQEKVEWHRLVAFRRLGEVIGEYVKKGSKLYIEGRLQTRKWTAEDGSDRYSTEIIVDQMQMLDSRAAGNAPAQQDSHNQAKSNGYQQQEPPPHDGGFDDDIPF